MKIECIAVLSSDICMIRILASPVGTVSIPSTWSDVNPDLQTEDVTLSSDRFQILLVIKSSMRLTRHVP
jgi:hypothetical protein